MNLRLMMKTIGAINLFLGCLMFIPATFAFFDGMKGFWPFIDAIAICLAISALLYFSNFKATGEISRRDGLAIVGLVWFSTSCFAAIPFYLNGGFGDSFTNALFESVSGFTTTGASILVKISILPQSILLWRSMIQWLGGMGIVLLSMAVLPFLGFGETQLFRAEVPGPPGEKITPRIKETAKLLWWVYLFITAGGVLMLYLAGMNGFDAVCHSLTAVATGGFSTRDGSVMVYNNAAIEMVLILLMAAGGCNFTLHYLALKGKPLSYFKDSEFQGYLLFTGLITGLIAVTLWYNDIYKGFLESLRHALFQTVSLMTTTGYNTVDFEQWRISCPATALLLIIAMFLGGMAGSTGGGIKIVRIQIILLRTYLSIKDIIHPRAINKVKIKGAAVPDDQMKSITSFFLVYLFIFVLSTIVISFAGLDLVSAVSAVSACLNNVGPGFGVVGPLANFDPIPFWGKWVLILNMLIGRLEIFTILLLFVPEFWKG